MTLSKYFYSTGLLFLIFFLSMIMTGCGNTQPQDPFDLPNQEAFSPAGPKHAPSPGEMGPFQVGVKTIRLKDDSRKTVDGRSRPIVIEIWYPAKVDLSNAKKDEYDIRKDGPKEILEHIAHIKDIPTLAQNAYRDAEFIDDDNSYPILLYSHSSSGLRYQSVFYLNHLASHGYIVASVDHHENTFYDNLLGQKERDTNVLLKSAQDRPKDTLFLFERLKSWNVEKGHWLENRLQLENIGLTGHSFGGLSSILSTRVLPKIKAVVLHAPYTSLSPALGVTPKDLVDIPLMILASKNDLTLDYQKEQKKFFNDLLQKDAFGADRFLISFLTGGHLTFSDVCALDFHKFALELGYESEEEVYNNGCSESNIPIPEAHNAINHYSTALFNLHLRQSEDSKKYLLSLEKDNVLFEHASYVEQRLQIQK